MRRIWLSSGRFLYCHGLVELKKVGGIWGNHKRGNSNEICASPLARPWPCCAFLRTRQRKAIPLITMRNQGPISTRQTGQNGRFTFYLFLVVSVDGDGVGGIR